MNNSFVVGNYSEVSRIHFKCSVNVIEYLKLQLKSFSDAILSQQPSPKNFLQFFFLVFLTNLDEFGRNWSK